MLGLCRIKHPLTALLVIFRLLPPHFRHVKIIFFERRVSPRLSVHMPRAMAHPLPPDHQRCFDPELELDLLEGTGVAMSDEIKQQLFISLSSLTFPQK